MTYALLLWACKAPPTPIPTPTDTGHTGAPTRDTGPPTWDCADLPSGPFDLERVPGARANEDLTFADGALFGADVATHVWRARRNGVAEVIRLNSGYHAGFRQLLDGDLVAASYETGSVDRLDPVSGASMPLVSGLAYPNGIEIGPDGRVYVTEWGGGRLLRIDTDTSQTEVLAEGLGTPNGLSFDVAYQTLWVVSNIEGNPLYRIPIAADGTAGTAVHVMDTGSVGVDGLAVDACDNLYLLSYTHELIRRWDGATMVDLVDRGNTGMGLGNLAWGDPSGGWDPLRAHVVWYGANEVLAFDLGVPEKPRPGSLRPRL